VETPGAFAVPGTTTSAQLEAVREAFLDTARRGRELAAALDAAAWARRPASGGWSAAECLGHLNITTKTMAPLMREAIDRAHTSGQPPASALKADLLGRLLAWFLEPPYRVRGTTRPAFVPSADLPKASVLEEWDRQHRELGALVDLARGTAIDRVKIVSPFDPRGRLRYSVYSAFLILVAHERRHLWQASKAAGFGA